MEQMIFKNNSKKKQIFLIILCWIVYSVAQLGRYSYSANINLIMDKYSVNHTDASLPTTLFFFCYGIGQILNAFFCKKYNKRFVVVFVLIISGIINLSVFFNISFKFIKYLWSINGLVQSTLWVVLLLFLSERIEKKYLSICAIIMSAATTGGTFLSYGMSALVTALNYFELSFLISGILLCIVSLLWFLSLGKYNKTKNGQAQEILISTNEVPKHFVLMLCMFCLFCIVSYAVAGGLKSWSPAILREVFGLENWVSTFLSVFLPFCAIFNATICDILYKKLKSFVLVCIVSFAVSIIFIIPIIFILDFSVVLTLIFLLIITLSCGVVTNALTVQVPLLLKNKKVNSGFLAGILNGSCYIGSAISTYSLGVIADNSEWNKVFVLFAILCFVSLVIALLFYFLTKGKKHYD